MANEIITTLHPDQDPDTNLYPNIKKECIPQGAVGRGKLDSDVNSLLNNIGSMSPKGTYSTLEELQTAFPSGTDGVYLVSGNGYWYYWNGTTWTAGGIYEASVNYDGLEESIEKTNSIIGVNYEKVESDWEKGNQYLDNGSLVLASSNTVIRNKTPLFLPQGTIVKTTDGHYIRAIIKKGTEYFYKEDVKVQGTTAYEENIVLDESGYYLFAFENGGETITSVSDKLYYLTITVPYPSKINKYTSLVIRNRNMVCNGWSQEVSELSTLYSLTVLSNKWLLPLKKGTFVYTDGDENYQFRLVVKDGDNFVSVAPTEAGYITSYYCNNDIECYISIRRVGESITDNTKWFNHIHIVENCDIEKYKYNLDKGNFVSGSFFVQNNSLLTSTGNSVIRHQCLFNMKEGDVVKAINGYAFRLIIKTGSSYAYAWGDNTWRTYFEIPNDGIYILVVRGLQDATSIDVVEALENIIMAKSPNYLSNYLKTTHENEIVANKKEVAVVKGLYAIMTYNVGSWYDGTGVVCPVASADTYLTLDETLLDTYLPDYLFTQEYRETFGNTTIKDALLNNYFKNNEDTQSGTTYGGKSINTNYRLFDTSTIIFTNNDGTDRNVFKGYTYINGKKVCIMSTHLSTVEATRNLEVQELLELVEEEEYFILCGDFNADCSSTTDQAYIDVFKPFADLGYNLANCSSFGFLPTYYSLVSERYLVLDNVITSSNITIKSVVVDEIKDNDASITRLDHMPLIAYVEIN